LALPDAIPSAILHEGQFWQNIPGARNWIGLRPEGETNMNTSSKVERLTGSLARAQQHWETRAQAAQASAYTIALSRAAGVPGTTIAREVGNRLGWTVYDHELLERIAAGLGVRTQLLESVDMKRMSWLQECVEAFSTVPAVSENVYVRHLIETMLSLAEHGECVIVGRGAAQILADRATTLRVRLIASHKDRVEMTCRRLGMTRSEAARHIDTLEQERVRFVRDHFHKDPVDAQNYDLVVNCSRFSTLACADLIIESLHRLKARSQTEGEGTVPTESDINQ
jgi:cytidylate kinase